MVGNRQQFAQTSTRIRCLRFIANRFCRRLLAGCRVCHGLLDGLVFVHFDIIARISASVPVLLVVPDLMWGFLATAAARRYTKCSVSPEVLAQRDQRAEPAEAGGERQQQGRIARVKGLEDQC